MEVRWAAGKEWIGAGGGQVGRAGLSPGLGVDIKATFPGPGAYRVVIIKSHIPKR